MLVGDADDILGSQGHQDCGAVIRAGCVFFTGALRLSSQGISLSLGMGESHFLFGDFS